MEDGRCKFNLEQNNSIWECNSRLFNKGASKYRSRSRFLIDVVACLLGNWVHNPKNSNESQGHCEIYNNNFANLAFNWDNSKFNYLEHGVHNPKCIGEF